MNKELLATILIFTSFYIIWKLFNKVISPMIITHNVKEIDRNPKWITSRLHYYGLKDIDIVLCESKLGTLPLFYTRKDKLELWIDYDTPVRETEEIGRLALVGKLKIKYDLWFPDKPAYWLSILCYLLDGGNIQVSDISQIRNDGKQETS